MNTEIMNMSYSKVIETLILAKADVNAIGTDGMTELMRASNKGDLDVVETLIKAGANVEIWCKTPSIPSLPTDRGGEMTALLSAAFEGHTDVVEALIEAKADVNVNDHRLYSPLICACINGHTDTARLLIESWAHVNAESWECADDANEFPPLTWATTHGHLEIVKLLLTEGRAQVNEEGWGCLTALQHAVSKQKTDIVELLLESNAAPNVKNGIGDTPMITASKFGYADIVALLYYHGADDCEWNDNYDTALVCASKEGHTDVVEVLTEHRDDAFVRDDHAPLTIAIECGHTKVVELLLKAYTYKRVWDDVGEWAMEMAIEKGHTDIVELLRLFSNTTVFYDSDYGSDDNSDWYASRGV